MSKKYILSKEDTIKLLNEHMPEIRKYSVIKIGLFGSIASNKQTLDSDIDLVVEFSNPSLDNYFGLEEFLGKLFKRKIDILTPMGVESIRVKRVYNDIKRTLVYV